eukprot:XP_002939041.2 PREDICTED: uncharacterized protein LOC100490667 [Xenopus tropicalis]
MGLLPLENLTLFRNNMLTFTELLLIAWTLPLVTCAGGDVPLPVTGHVGETVTLPPCLNLTDPIDRVTWMFHNDEKRIFLAEFRDQKFIRENENYFPNRLEGSNSGTALLIRELRMEDCGIFTAQFLVNEEMRDINYFLAVFAGGGGGGDVHLPVTGRVGETVTLPGPKNLTDTIIGVSWMFFNNGKKILLGVSRNQKFIRVNENYFPNRLEGSNSGTTLLIRELRMEDSGIFTAQILVNGEMRDINYNVTVSGGGGGDVPLPVTGRVGETVTLTPRLTLTHPIDRVTWMFHVNGKRIILAEFRDQKFIRENGNYFPNRLEGSNSGTVLLIRELRMEDCGIFTAQILVNGEMRDINYNVTVLESIPTPVIKKTLDGNSPDLCRLHCSVPSNSPTLSYSWTYRDTGTDRLYANGSTITVSLKDKALGAEFTCWVQNSTYRNNASVLLYPCGTDRGYQRLIIPITLLCVILGIIAVCVCIKRLIMDKKTPKDDLTYSVIAFPNRNSNQVTCNQHVNSDCIMESNKINDNTEYAVLVMDNGLNEKV